MPTYHTSGRDPLLPTQAQLAIQPYAYDEEYGKQVQELQAEWGRDYAHNMTAVSEYVAELPSNQQKRYDSPEGARKVLQSALLAKKLRKTQ